MIRDWIYVSVKDVTTETTGLVTTYKNSLGAEILGLEYLFPFDTGKLLKWDRSLFFFVNDTRILSAIEELKNRPIIWKGIFIVLPTTR